MACVLCLGLVKKAPLGALKGPQGVGYLRFPFLRKVLEVESVLLTAAVPLMKLTFAQHFNLLVR